MEGRKRRGKERKIVMQSGRERGETSDLERGKGGCELQLRGRKRSNNFISLRCEGVR